MLAKNAESALAGLGCWLIRQPRQPINSETEFTKANQSPADKFIVREFLSFFSQNCLSTLLTLNQILLPVQNLIFLSIVKRIQKQPCDLCRVHFDLTCLVCILIWVCFHYMLIIYIISHFSLIFIGLIFKNNSEG